MPTALTTSCTGLGDYTNDAFSCLLQGLVVVVDIWEEVEFREVMLVRIKDTIPTHDVEVCVVLLAGIKLVREA